MSARESIDYASIEPASLVEDCLRRRGTAQYAAGHASLPLDDAQAVTVQITRNCAGRETEASEIPDWSWRDQANSMLPRQIDQCREATRDERRFPMGDIVRAEIEGRRASISRREILEELDSWSLPRPERRDPQPRAKHIVQVLLLFSVVLTFTRYLQSQRIAIQTK
jgi:hypothetical protein